MNTRIAFLGLGNMGLGMVRRLLTAGFAVTVYNRSFDKAQALAAEGATPARTPREAAQGAQVIVAMVSDDVASREIWLGDHGVLAAAAPGAICIDCSTLTLSWVRELSDDCAARGLRFLDAPVLGTKTPAARGELVVLVGGDAEVLEAARPVLARFAREIVHAGPTGAGATLKLANNFLGAIHAAAMGEAIALLAASGIDLPKALGVLAAGAAGSPMAKMVISRHLARDPEVHFRLGLMTKDVTYALAAGRQHHLEMPAATTALHAFNAAVAAGYGDRDISAILEYLAPA